MESVQILIPRFFADCYPDFGAKNFEQNDFFSENLEILFWIVDLDFIKHIIL
jgi:hypothetical protein